ncbi:DUF262 domain-containing protein [Idiomarina abyssalis]|uniref:DUF262 domain-containing protein n=1 Tax=Idiomarina abyssalis TaxID=86102 RepID=UPI003A91551E
MQSDLFTASKLFTERLFRIPDYQRGYAWTEKQLKDYWTDVQQLEENKSHYLGVITLEDVPKERYKEWQEDQWIIESKSFEPFYVVDGQQRLTTTIILIQAITEVIEEGTKLNYTSLDEIKGKFLWDSKDDISRSYIFGYEKDNPSYEFLKTNIFLEESTSSATPQETIYTSNLLKAKTFFLEKLREFQHSEIEAIYKKVTQQFLFNIYAISREVDVFVAFETMNNRGKPLSHLELLKNRLIYLSTKFDACKHAKTSLRAAINESWKSVYHYLGKNKDNPLDDDFFLRTHFLLYFGKDFLEEDEGVIRSYRYIRRHYLNSFKEYLLEDHFTPKNLSNSTSDKSQNVVTIESVHEYSKNLKRSVELWYQILNPEDCSFSQKEIDWLQKLNRMGIEFTAPLIMVFFQQEKAVDKRLDLLMALEQLLFCNLLVRYRYYMEFEPFNFVILACRLSSGKESPESVIKDIKSSLNRMKVDKLFWAEVEKYFRGSGFYEWSGIRYFLYEYDLSLRERSKTYREKIDWNSFTEDLKDFHTVEHIYPQRPRKSCWTDVFEEYSQSERKKLRHSLGNLVPLSRAKNSSFQNKCFKDKKGRKDSTIGFSYGSFSENEIAQNDEWTAKHILDRGLKLLDFMEERWSLTLGNKEAKTHMLGLEFMKKESSKSKKKTK